jgi:neutral ceramidase
MVTACPAALGYSFAAGTSDGPGAFDFKQNSSGSPNASPLWEVVKAFIKEPSEKQKQCQGLKPVLLDVGEIHSPYEWSPNIVDIQLLRVGQLIIIVSPGEATTMAGRRWRDAIHDGAISGKLMDSNETDPIVVLGGPANSYTHYIATEEEYGVQRYEGASTLYGPHTLNAYINLTFSNLHYLSPASTGKPALGPEPPINTNRSLSFITGVIMDNSGFGHSFGDVTEDVQSQYSRSSNSVVSVKFIGANPRNNLRLEKTYAAVEKLGADGSTWAPFRNDEDWELVYRWRRVSEVMGTSEVTIEWEIPADVEAGKYRVRYFGDSKSLTGTITAFEGVSAMFDIV